MIGWLIVVAVLLLIWFLPLGVSAVYNQNGSVAKLLIGPLSFWLYPKKKKKTEQNTKESAKKKSNKKESSKKGGSYKDFIPIVHLLVDFLEAFRKKLWVKRLEIKLVMAGSDPCDLAVNYGKAWAAVGNLFPLLERVFVIKKRNVEVECDFTADKTLIYARLDLTITVGRILSLGAVHGIRMLREFINLTKLRKGGNDNEPKSS